MATDDRDDGQRVEIRPELAARFAPQFDACLALYWFAREHRPDHPPMEGAAGRIILWTYARSSATYQASIRLSAAGYGPQAAMLNRSLWEDMLIGHWVKRHPAEAPQKLADHDKVTLARWGAKLRENQLQPNAEFPTLTASERKAARQRYGGKTWTELSLPQILLEIRDEWPSPADHRLVQQVADLVHGVNNTLLHHNARALAVARNFDEERQIETLIVGPSDVHISGALLGAFFTYANTTSLVLGGDDAAACSALYQEHIPAFTVPHSRTLAHPSDR